MSELIAQVELFDAFCHKERAMNTTMSVVDSMLKDHREFSGAEQLHFDTFDIWTRRIEALKSGVSPSDAMWIQFEAFGAINQPGEYARQPWHRFRLSERAS